MSKQQTDLLLIYDSLIDALYARALTYYQTEKNKKISSVADLTNDELLAFFKQSELPSHLFMFKGISAINIGDVSLAGRMFTDAISSIPQGIKFSEPYFYLMVTYILTGWPDDKLKELAQTILKNDKNFSARQDSLWQRISSIQTENLKDKLASYF